MRDEETIEALVATNEVYIAVTADTINAYGVSAQRWHRHINRYNTFGALVEVYSPLPDKEVFLPWAAILTVEAVPAYE
jgi:hypothetical protein